MEILNSPFMKKMHEQRFSVEKLIDQFSIGNKYEYVFFWKTDKHNMSKGCFSQWQESYFRVNDYEYNCAEQYMMGQKALLFNDEETFERILSAVNPREIKSLGREVKNFDSKTWDEEKYSIVLNGNFYKFTQNTAMMEILVSTGSKILVEASPLDKIWGVGIAEDNENICNPNYWKGKNLLGFALMELREEVNKIITEMGCTATGL
jgi:ribA/ribD-fused uncharacterized protein